MQQRTDTLAVENMEKKYHPQVLSKAICNFKFESLTNNQKPASVNDRQRKCLPLSMPLTTLQTVKLFWVRRKHKVHHKFQMRGRCPHAKNKRVFQHT